MEQMVNKYMYFQYTCTHSKGALEAMYTGCWRFLLYITSYELVFHLLIESI